MQVIITVDLVCQLNSLSTCSEMVKFLVKDSLLNMFNRVLV